MAAEAEEEGLLASVLEAGVWAGGDGGDGARESVVRYLRELSGSGLERLRREPERLREERAQLGQQTRALACRNYQTFIRGARCTQQVHGLFATVEDALARLLARLPDFQHRCRNFVKEAEEIGSSRRMNSLTLNRHTEILEILEIPQLMDTCVRNGYYEEALELAAYVRRLERKYSAIPVIQGIVNEVRQSTQLMLSQLIQQLRTNIQLPACLRVIGYLRRMDVFTEAELRIKFLQARDAWLRCILAAVPGDDPYFHITKTIEACRVHLFDIVTQYRAIFSDEEPPPPPPPPAAGERPVNESAIFHGWVLQKVSRFLRALEADLRRGVGGRLDSLLGQCMYFGLSFSRVGADFRGQLAPVFQQVAVGTFRRAVDEAVEKFREEMNCYTLISAPAILGSTAPPGPPGTQPGTLQPPMVLLDFPPLACFLNNILVSFNELRLCCPVALARDVTVSLEDALVKGGEGGLQQPGAGAVRPVLHRLPGRLGPLPQSMSSGPFPTGSDCTDFRCPPHSALQVWESRTRERQRGPGAAGLCPAKEGNCLPSGRKGASPGAPGSEFGTSGTGADSGTRQPTFPRDRGRRDSRRRGGRAFAGRPFGGACLNSRRWSPRDFKTGRFTSRSWDSGAGRGGLVRRGSSPGFGVCPDSVNLNSAQPARKEIALNDLKIFSPETGSLKLCPEKARQFREDGG
ncbi:conserved oligomeric Golgi complex subunit 8 isoform X3 [Tachyglossus aculeatus]|uniref:conserved oligomeric Golgi complex subunit 8 isoform X3 n=1 Tax=Tachyglossus aculeatus TaxID=9261 RepID=UPI0018F5D6E7|nr:conserved oligomeric Golgi complex subunit 8 isoform X3 [Tachyglossus aculeatus]